MEFLESLTKLSESDQQKIFETLQILKNVRANVSSNDSVSKSGANSIESPNNVSEKPVSKQKTLDSWIVKNKTAPSNCKKKVTFSTTEISITETGEQSSNISSKEVSSTLQNLQIASNPLTPVKKSIISGNEINSNEKHLRVLLNRGECYVSKQKSPEYNKFSPVRTLEIKSPRACNPGKNQELFSEDSDQTVRSPEKHVTARSYNLRSAKLVSDEKGNSETSNLTTCTPESIEADKSNKSDHKLVAKQNSKSKNCLEKAVSLNSNTSFDEVKCDQNTNLCNNKIPRENINNSDRRVSIIVQPELEEKVINTNKNLAELDAAVVGKEKRKRIYKNKESKETSVSNETKGSSSIQESATTEKITIKIKNSQSNANEKVTKPKSVSATSFKILNEKPIQVLENKYSTPGQQQTPANDFVKPIIKQKTKKNIKSNDEISILKFLPIQEINSNNEKNIDFEKSSNSLLESQSNVCAKSTGELLKRDATNKITINSSSKRTLRKVGNKNLLPLNFSPDSRVTSKNNEKTINISPIRNEETEELTKETNNGISLNLRLKKTSRKEGNKNISPLNILPDSGLTLENNQDTIISTETLTNISTRQNNQYVKETKEILTKDINNSTSVNLPSKRINRKTDNKSKSMRIIMNNSPESGQTPKNTQDTLSSFEISAKISPTQNKEFVRETEELLNKTKNDEKSVNFGSKKTNRKTCDKYKSISSMNTSPVSRLTRKNNQGTTISTEISTNISTTQNKEFDKRTQELLTKDAKKNSVNLYSKKISRKAGNKKTILSPRDASSDLGLSPKNNEDTIMPFEILANISPTQNKESAMETEELTKETNYEFSVNLGSKKTSRKGGNKNKSISPKISSPDLRLAPESNQDAVTFEISAKISPSQNKDPSKETEELTKDTNEKNSVNLGPKRKNKRAGNKSVSSRSSDDSGLTFENNEDIKNLPNQNEETKELNKDKNKISLNLGSKKTARKAGNKNVSPLNTIPDSGTTPENNQDITSTEILANISQTQNNEFVKETEEIQTKDINEISANLRSKRISRKTDNNKSVLSVMNNSPDIGQTPKSNKDTLTSFERSAIVSPTQIMEFAKETEELLVQSVKSGNSKRICKKKDRENKNMVITKNNNPDLTSKSSEKNSAICTETSSINSENSLSQCNESVKETGDLLIKDMNTVNLDSKRKSRRRGSENKSVAKIKKCLLSNSKHDAQNKSKDSIVTLELLSKDSSSSNTNDISIKSTRSVKDTSTHVNRNKHVQPIMNEESDAFPTKLNSLNEVEELSENQFQGMNVVSTKTPKSIDNTSLHPQECSKLSSVSKKVNTLKRKTLVQSSKSSKKKLKITKDEEGYPNISDKLGTKMENPEQSFTNCDSKKNVKSSKQKVEIDSNKDCSGILITNIKDSNSNIIKKPIDKFLKNSKSNNLPVQSQKEIISVENLKNVDESSSITETKSMDSEAEIDFNLSEIEHTYEAYCQVKDELKAVGISIEEFFEIPEIIDSLKSEQPEGVLVISKCKIDSEISVFLHESKVELKNIIDNLKKKYTDVNK